METSVRGRTSFTQVDRTQRICETYDFFIQKKSPIFEVGGGARRLPPPRLPVSHPLSVVAGFYTWFAHRATSEFRKTTNRRTPFWWFLRRQGPHDRTCARMHGVSHHYDALATRARMIHFVQTIFGRRTTRGIDLPRRRITKDQDIRAARAAPKQSCKLKLQAKAASKSCKQKRAASNAKLFRATQSCFELQESSCKQTQKSKRQKQTPKANAKMDGDEAHDGKNSATKMTPNVETFTLTPTKSKPYTGV